MPSTAANPLAGEEASPPRACHCEGKAMALVRVDPKLGAMPELRTYRCGQCGAVETIEVKQPASKA